MSKPNIEQRPGIIIFNWDAEMVAAHVSRIKEHGDSITARVTFTTSLPAYFSHIYQDTFNILAGRTRVGIAKILAGKVPTISLEDWDAMLEQLCRITEDLVSKGSPVQMAASDGVIIPTEFLIHPLLEKNKVTMLYGDGGTGKSIIAEAIQLIVRLPWAENPLRLLPAVEPTIGLYLDWEVDFDTYKRRLQRMVKGMGADWIELAYRDCYRPFAQELPAIQEMMRETGATFLILDSVSGACGTDDMKEAAAAMLVDTVRSMRCTALLIHHISKAPGSEKTPYGTAFWRNKVRSLWEIVKHQDVNADTIDVGLYHRKANDTRLFPPMGLRLAFSVEDDDEATSIERRDKSLSEREELAKGLSQSRRITIFLSDASGDPKTQKQIADDLGIPFASVKSRMTELKKADVVVSLPGDRWALKARVEYP